MSATDELLPCPFCGGKARLESDYSSEAGVTLWNVWHECDGFEGRGSGFGSALSPWFDTPWYEDRDTAIAAWNRRADHD